MPIHKRPEESYTEYRERVLHSISPSFCGAKWYNATVWLGSGTTTSCHHPPAHKIPLVELKRSYKALHNTEYKKLVREQMLRGEKPKECEYCWKIESLGPDKVSDRIYKSIIYTEEELREAVEKYKSTTDVDLKTLEIAFDAVCNFACSYCNSSFSTKWQNDIKMNGPYQNLVSDGAAAFQQDGSWAQPYGLHNENNPYVDAFWQWWENELQYSLTELRVTGGEATMSPNFWKLMDWWKEHPECNVEFAVNSNLGSRQLVEKLTDSTHSFKSFQLYTSCEAFGKQAEYIRDGLEWDTWLSNLRYCIKNGNVKQSNIMMTINALCLFSICEFMNEMLKIREEFGSYHALMSFNILRFPSFQSPTTLPTKVRKERAFVLESWLKKQENNKLLNDIERDGIKRLISYLHEIEEGHSFVSSLETRERDFKSFYNQYDTRRNKNFTEAFPELKEWYDSIPFTQTEPLVGLVDGDSTKQMPHVQELKKIAAKEGWIIKPKFSNPGSQDYDSENEIKISDD